MEIKWKRVTGSQAEKPGVIDRESSSRFVYLRRNVERITQEDTQGNPVLLWQYEEAALTREEYAQYDTIATELLQAEMDARATEQERQNAVMQSNIEYIAMMADIDLEV